MNLKKYCKKIIKLNKFSNKIILKYVNFIDPKKRMSILIGSGFAEKINDHKIISSRRNFGNNLQVFDSINNPRNFFKKLEEVRIKFPKISFQKPESNFWLKKSTKSSGGQLVTFSHKNISKDSDQVYFQEIIKGKVFSVQFFTNEKKLSILSICSIQTYKSNNKPFLLKGIRTKNINKHFYKKIEELCIKVSNTIKLNGVNNIDFIIKKEKLEELYLLEINPRPGLSTKIISPKLKKILLNSSYRSEKECGSSSFQLTQIIYAKDRFFVKEKIYEYFKDLSKSKIFSELPKKNDIICKGDPVCLVHLKSRKNKNLTEKIKKISIKIQNDLKSLNLLYQ